MHPQLITVIRRASGLPVSQVQSMLRPPLDHQSNRLYDVWAGERHWIAKEFLKPEEWGVAPAREHRALVRLAGLDMAALPIFFDPALGPIVGHGA
jgi:hypothetical protein